MRLGEIVNKSWTELSEKGYWQRIWRGSVQLEVTVWEERVQLSEEDFERIKQLIQAIDEHDLSVMHVLALTDQFLVNSRQTRYYAQRAGSDDRVVELYDELLRLMQVYYS